MVELKLGIKGAEELRRRIGTARRALKDFKPWLKLAALIAQSSAQKNIDAGGRPRWVELAESTLQRRKTGPGAGVPEPLRDEGLLLASIMAPATHEDGVFELDNFKVQVGTNLKYAGPQHFGTGDGHIPARPFMFLQDDDERNIIMLMDEFLDKALGPA